MIKQSKNQKNGETQTLTPEELQEFRGIYEGYQKAVYDLGVLNLEVDKVQKRLNELGDEKLDLVSHINNLDDQQVSIANRLGDKYGLKQVDLETGELK